MTEDDVDRRVNILNRIHAVLNGRSREDIVAVLSTAASLYQIYDTEGKVPCGHC